MKVYKVKKKQHFLLAVSGGIDSMVMLDFFNNNSKLADISVCYVNHHYHSRSDEMGKLVSTYCANNSIPYIESSINLSKVKNNIEAQFRKKDILSSRNLVKKLMQIMFLPLIMLRIRLKLF